ncbi:phage integrase SAM-like domain-containing protein [Allomuricauda sp. F6463D]
MLSFENYLRTCTLLLKPKPLGNNGIMKHMKRFKKMAKKDR